MAALRPQAASGRPACPCTGGSREGSWHWRNGIQRGLSLFSLLWAAKGQLQSGSFLKDPYKQRSAKDLRFQQDLGRPFLSIYLMESGFLPLVQGISTGLGIDCFFGWVGKDFLFLRLSLPTPPLSFLDFKLQTWPNSVEWDFFNIFDWACKRLDVL